MSEWQIERFNGDARIEVTQDRDGSVVSIALPTTGRALASTSFHGSYAAGDVYRLSARVASRALTDHRGQTAVADDDENLDLDAACILLSQYDSKGREVSSVASGRLLGDTAATTLSLEVPIQQDITRIDVQCRCIDVSGEATFRDIRIEKLPLAPLRPIPDARFVRNAQGALALEVDGERVPWNIYHGNHGFGSDRKIVEGMRLATANGVRIVSFRLRLPCSESIRILQDRLEQFVKPFPDAYFVVRVWLGEGSGFHHAYPEEYMVYADGSRGPMASLASERWRELVGYNLEQLIHAIRRTPYARQYLGMVPMYLHTGEWINPEGSQPAGFSEPVRVAFARWARARYGSLEALNAAWHTSFDRFEALTVPSLAERDAASWGMFRDPATQRHAIDFTEFYNALAPEALNEFGAAIKRAGDGHGLVGAFYGYTFESCWNETWTQQFGHLAFAELLRDKNIDFCGAPYSYNFRNRALGLPMNYHGPFDSAALHAKPAFVEEDTFTHLADEPAEGLTAPGYIQRAETLEESLSLLKRNMGYCIARGNLLHWQDLLGEGRFSAPEIWSAYRRNLELWSGLQEKAGIYSPQVAVAVDEGSFRYLARHGIAVHGRWAYETRMFLDRVDTSIGYYLQSDLDRIPESVRCLVLLTPYHMTEAEKEALQSRWMRDGRTIVFCYLPNVFEDDAISTGGSSICGIRLRAENKPIDPESTLLPGSPYALDNVARFGCSTDWNKIPSVMPPGQYGAVSPYMVVEDPQATVFARYVQNDLPSCAVKRMGEWTSIYLGSAGLPPALWRKIFAQAGCHLYLDSLSEDFDRPDAIEASDGLLMLQSGSTGPRTIRLPQTRSRIYRFDGERQLIAQDTDTFTENAIAGQPVFFVFE